METVTDPTFLESFMSFASTGLIPVMCIFFTVAVTFRVLIYFTVKREDWFSKEFDKRIRAFLETEHVKNVTSFFVVSKMLMERTYYELFEVRSIMKRRKPDVVMAFSDRVFLIQHGSACLVRDTLKQIKYLKYGTRPPKFLEISKSVFQNNPCFNKVFGILPITLFNDVLGVLPGIFIIGGIFGTFLGIMDALPKLGGMDLNNVEATNLIMTDFLDRIAFAMRTSIVGIIFSVSMTFFNTFFSCEKLFVSIVDRFENSMDILWDRSETNDLPESIVDFDEHRDPIEALAEQSLQNQLNKDEGGVYVHDAESRRISENVETNPEKPGDEDKSEETEDKDKSDKAA